MDGISIPPSLANATATLTVAESLAKILDPKERARIADDIKAHHALNETEAQKYAEAKSLIEQHKEILQQTRDGAAQNLKDKQQIVADRERLNSDISASNNAIALEKDRLAEEKQKNLDILKEAKDAQQDVLSREEKLTEERKLHEENVKLLEADRKSFVDSKAERQSIIDALDKEIADKREIINAIRKFNI